MVKLHDFQRLPHLLFVLICCLQLCACQADNIKNIIPEQSAAPDETESIPQLLYRKTVTFDQNTGIRRTTLDTQGLPLNVYFEIPVFDKESVGYQKINTFFQNLEDDFFQKKMKAFSAPGSLQPQFLLNLINRRTFHTKIMQ